MKGISMQSFFRFNLFTLLLCLSAIPVIAEEQPLSESNDIPAVKKALKMRESETAIFVGDMHCANCAKKVARKLYGVKGVVKVRTDIKVDVAIVTPQQNRELDANALWAAAEKSGILPIKIIGPAGVVREADAAEKEAARKTHDHAAVK
jgi:copper chaperone CopZ